MVRYMWQPGLGRCARESGVSSDQYFFTHQIRTPGMLEDMGLPD